MGPLEIKLKRNTKTTNIDEKCRKYNDKFTFANGTNSFEVLLMQQSYNKNKKQNDYGLSHHYIVLLSVFLIHPVVNFSEVVRVTGYKRSSILGRFFYLEKHGYIIKCSLVNYELTDRGKLLMEQYCNNIDILYKETYKAYYNNFLISNKSKVKFFDKRNQ